MVRRVNLDAVSKILGTDSRHITCRIAFRVCRKVSRAERGMRWIFMITPSGPSHKHSTGQLFEDAQGNVQQLWFGEQAHELVRPLSLNPARPSSIGLGCHSR